MKTKILIIEDNYYRFFTTKQVLESQLKLNVKVEGAGSGDEILYKADSYKQQNILYRPEGGIKELIAVIKRKRLNRLNCEITLLVMPEFSYGSHDVIANALASKDKRAAFSLTKAA